jgi:hypothetical protein
LIGGPDLLRVAPNDPVGSSDVIVCKQFDGMTAGNEAPKTEQPIRVERRAMPEGANYFRSRIAAVRVYSGLNPDRPKHTHVPLKRF